MLSYLVVLGIKLLGWKDWLNDTLCQSLIFIHQASKLLLLSNYKYSEPLGGSNYSL